MTRRNSPNQINDLADLSQLGEIVVDKRLGQRAQAKKSRRNRHYEQQFIRNTLTRVSRSEVADMEGLPESPPLILGIKPAKKAFFY
jgi:hypothetical protein